MKKKVLYLIITLAVCFTSCDEDCIELQNPSDVVALKKVIKKNFDGNLKVETLELSTTNLSKDLQEVRVNYWKNGEEYTFYYCTTTKKEEEEKVLDVTTEETSKREPKGALRVSDFPIEQITQDFEKAVELIEEAYPVNGTVAYHNFTLRSYNFEVQKDQSITSWFTLQGTKVGEDKSVNKDYSSIASYDFSFSKDAKGSITYNR
ncbi:MAG: hypothetical protein LBE34_10745 [Flavobacteriaceae bacterium]|nr:hypothetical protein [Flavobacteriaceae bacterium]